MSGASRNLAVVVTHGFSCSTSRLALQTVMVGLRPHPDVQVMDLQAYDRSTRLCTFGDPEVLDVGAAVGVAAGAARRLGYQRVCLTGWSMGWSVDGAAVPRHGVLIQVGEPAHSHRRRHPPEAVANASAASRWFVRDTARMRRIHRLAERPTGRMVARRLLRVRIGPHAFVPIPASPVKIVGSVAPTSPLIVHGCRDGYFTLRHPRALAAARTARTARTAAARTDEGPEGR